MKKIFKILIYCYVLLIILFISPLILKTKAESFIQDLVIIVNNPISSEELMVDGYTIYSNNVNYNEVGNYNIVYTNERDEKINRTVKVIEKKSGGIKESNIAYAMQEGVTEVKKIDINSEGNSYFLILNYEVRYGKGFRIIYCEDDYVLWNKNYNLYLVNAVLISKSYPHYLVISAYHPAGINELIIINHQAKETKIDLKYPVPIDFTYNEYNKCLYFLYKSEIIKLTYQDLGELGHLKLKELFNKNEYKLLDYRINETTIEFFYLIDNLIYYYKVNMDLLILDQLVLDFEKIDSLIVSNYSDNICTLKIENNKLDISIYDSFYSSNYNQKRIIFDSNIVNVKCEFNRDILYLTVTTIIDGDIEDDKEEATYETKNYLIFNDLVQEVNLYDYDRFCFNQYSFCYTKKDNNLCYNVNGVDLIINEEQRDDLTTYERLYFFKDGAYLDTFQDTTYKSFGLFTNVLKKEIDNVLYIINYDYYVSDNCNILNNEEYLPGININFLGEGYLNDEKIDSGHIINEEGVYSLRLIGENESKVINFKVSNLNEKSKIIHEFDNNISAKTIVLNKKEQDELIININDEANFMINPYIYIIMSIVLSGLLIILIRKRRKK